MADKNNGKCVAFPPPEAAAQGITLSFNDAMHTCAFKMSLLIDAEYKKGNPLALEVVGEMLCEVIQAVSMDSLREAAECAPPGSAGSVSDLIESRALVDIGYAVKPDPLAEDREHLTTAGKFRSDKYPWSQDGFLPLKVSDEMAWPMLRLYADARAAVDEDFCRDLHEALDNVGAPRLAERIGPERMEWVATAPEFRGLWKSRCMEDDGSIESGWALTFIKDGEYTETPYQKTPEDAIDKARKLLDPPRKFWIDVNGYKVQVTEGDTIHYEKAVEMSGLSQAQRYTITWALREHSGTIIWNGVPLLLKDGMRFDLAVTDNA